MDTFSEFNYCATDYTNKKKKCVLTLYTGEKVTLPKKCKRYTHNNGCFDSAKLGMTIQDYNIAMAITSNFIGFTLIFLVGFLFILQGKK
jgi:hypothetical protein